MRYLSLLLVGLFSGQCCLGDQDVLGCGGFIKASKSIDFSKINVQLLTKQGSLKYETDCAPNNGYYFIPVYENGDYILKVSPPLGWKFTPEEVSITIDGETDNCSLNKDINFVFAGFGVVGQVLAAGSSRGPAGVDIELLTGDQKEVVQKTVTVKDGKYVFTAVDGTDHKVRATHPVWEFEKSVGNVVITDNNGKADDLVVAGFDVRGKVLSGNQPIAGMDIVLFGKNSGVKCTDNSPADVSNPSGAAQVCRTKTDAKGEFLFPVLPSGVYNLVPFYRGEHTSFEVSPASKTVEVGLDSVVVAEPVFVEGFSVKGRVLTGVKGLPVVNAAVTLKSNKVHTTTTDKDGKYSFEKVETGTYTLSAKAQGIEFEEAKASISPSKPFLPDIAARKFLVSGQLDFSTVSADAGRKLKFASPGKPDVVVAIEGTGKFSKMLPASAYTVSVVSSVTDSQMGIVFAPLTLDVLLKTEPVSGLYFSPVRVTIAGSVRCITAECPELSVVLKPDGAGEESTQVVEQGRFSFQNQLPGRYSISVGDHANLCWQKPAIAFSIESDSKEDLEFVQTGWVMEVHASHETTLKVKNTEGKVVGNLDVPVGSSSHCMSTNTEHILQTTSCHQFQGENKGYKWKAGDKRVSLIADKHLVSGRLTCVETIPDLQVNVQSPTEMKTIALTQPETKDGLFSYRFSYYSSPHEELSLEPVAAKFLFNPTKLHISVANDCQVDSAVFTATKGLFVTGSIEPALSGAKIELSSTSLPQPALTSTDAKGKYSLGPFPRDLEYTMHAEKVGYVITQTSKKGHFVASKLASIVVNIVDVNGVALGEAVVSLSGGEQNFRTNQATGINGTLNFLGLSPGEYFIKPLLKEYEFSPKSKLITVKEGTEEIVDITATRIANSLFGVLTSLNGEAEPGVTLEAIGVEEQCRGHQEEGATALDGKFRIRGLTPNCEYRLGLKKSKSNAHVERTIPSVQNVKAEHEDVTGLEMIALHPRTNMDVSLLVKVKKENIKNVKAKLFCMSKPDSPLHTVKLDTVKFVIFPSIPADSTKCWITVEANSAHAGERVKPQRIEFTADQPFQHFNVQLLTESSLARGEMGQASWATLPIIILLVTAVLQWNTVSPFLRNIAEQVEGRLMKSRSTARRGNSPTPKTQEMSGADIDKAVKFVEASTRRKNKPQKI